MSKFTRKPKAHTMPGVEDFIAGAERRSEISDDMKSSHTISYESAALPWNQPGIRDDVLKVYNLRLPEPYLLKLRYIAEHTPDSMQKFCLDALLPAIDAKIEQILKGKD
ncbi:hypothetical protein [Methylocaldum szegediense]|uniref:Phage protein n=1 Tax=Methylocaldum szegediense TaxID=73780 RepID=A0ABM9I9U1_9GAMM|nr:hypothetical protein [Methylocaldum szegediense]CAI8982443.1 conserved protein of unknown function [Methylocaldum szegediense]